MQDVNAALVQALELQNAGNPEAAAAIFQAVIDHDAVNFVALYSMSLIALNRGEAQRALALIERALRSNVNFAQAHALKATALQAQKRDTEALVCFDAALALDPVLTEVLLNKGVLLHTLKRHHEALHCFERLLEINPRHTGALGNRGILLSELNRNAEAATAFEALLAIDPDFDYGLGLLAYARLHCCDWTGLDEARQKIESGVAAGKRVCKTLALMSISDSAQYQLAAARIFANEKYPRRSEPLWQGERYGHSKIKVTYVSPDFREHPVGHLSAGIFEQHDRSRFEIIGISLGIDDGGKLSKRFRAAFDQFIDVRGMTSFDVASRIRQMQVDIAVDLAGYTADSRTDIFAYRPAPTQVTWLGYPGTLGTDYFDYILADRHVIPERHEAFFAEKIARLPGSYLPTDGGLEVAEATPTRVDCGLPESGFVFCSFNHDYKISPPIFAIWMRLLKRVEGSVLWLMKLHEAAKTNLRLAAAAQGVDPERLIFATRVPRVEDHLARYRQADLFLDTYPYNAHTTAADALFVGLPVVTYMGNAFPGRVAGSLLHSIGLAELATESLEAYEALAGELARDRTRLAAIRQRLITNRGTHLLFDAKRFCRNLEASFAEMWRRQRSGSTPSPIAMSDCGTAIAMQTLAPRVYLGESLSVPDGWQVLRAKSDDSEHSVGCLLDLGRFKDASAEEIFCDQVLQRVPQAAIGAALSGMCRVLKPQGRLRILVPDLDALCRRFCQSELTTAARFELMRRMFGAQTDVHDFNLVGLSYALLVEYLAQAGFARAERVANAPSFATGHEKPEASSSLLLSVIAYRG